MSDQGGMLLRRDFRAEAEELDDPPRTASGMRAAVQDELPRGPSSSPVLSDTLVPPSSEILKRTILVVGLDLVPSLSGALRASGFTLSVVSTIESAKRLANELTPAAILVPPSPGPEPHRFLHWIRQQRRLGFVQVFVFAPDDKPSSVRDAIVAGADEVLVCGESSDELEQVVDRIAARVARSQSLADLSLLDPLTELHNRRFMNERLPAEIARAGRSRTTLSLAILDVDHFKTINDDLGHAAGDRALVAFSWVLRSNLRVYDIVCRFGGDEFVILFPDCSRARAREALAQLNAHAGPTSGLPAVTFSAGIAEFPHDGMTWTDLFDVADARMRVAKKLGPGHVVSGLM